MDWTAARAGIQPGQRRDRSAPVLRQVCFANHGRSVPGIFRVLHVAAVRRDPATRTARIDSALASHHGPQCAGYTGKSDDDAARGALRFNLCLRALSLWATGPGFCFIRESSLRLLSDDERLHGLVRNRFHHLASHLHRARRLRVLHQPGRSAGFQEWIVAGVSFTKYDVAKSTQDPGAAFRAGYVALIGRPNAGKSTLLNRLVGEKIAAVSNKPQTTRFKILGIVNRPEGQIVLVDTPGVHKPGYELNRRMMAAVHDALLAVDLVCLIRDASVSTGQGDRFTLDLVKQSDKPALLLLNKPDKRADKSKLLALSEWYQQEHAWQAVVPISALKGDQIEALLDEIIKPLPEGEPLFSEDEFTDQPMRVLAAEIVREKILEVTGEEIPYVTAVVTEKWEEVREDFTRIYCAIFVERASQKKIIIGHGAQRLKQIGIGARRDIEMMLGHRCHLELFVKVEEEWRDKQHLLDQLGVGKANPS